MSYVSSAFSSPLNYNIQWIGHIPTIPSSRHFCYYSDLQNEEEKIKEPKKFPYGTSVSLTFPQVDSNSGSELNCTHHHQLEAR